MKRLDKLHWTLLAVIAVLVALNAYVIISPYRYFHMSAPYGLVRVNRFTGEAERLLVGSGWKPVAPQKRADVY
jgi:hypothetical protein